ncbi:HIT-like protein [Nadsonia fulvescens var. elongata DSM 6958]|uniref:HIT-like protein n=1 Tax=Nadsonia fulvescens var. elongata DSM 6958 TaxID=857566 RepID=A0A1E3PPF7_9ASCO|nr:HIT-like protein [Nadsonia fulvescens var. elongata DSM 6958]
MATNTTPRNSRPSPASSFKFALQKYVDHPETAPKDVVIFYDENYTVIRDLFPKAIIHWLILPRKNSSKLPQKAFTSTAFYDATLTMVEKMRLRAEKELCSILAKPNCKQDVTSNNENDQNCGTNSSSQNLIERMNLPPPLYIKAGCHAVPSMSNLHIHIISSDMNGPNLKNKKHYNSFNTRFFIPFDELNQLKPDDSRHNNQIMHALIKDSDMLCSWCQRNFTNKFTALRAHLQEEYHTYVKEKAKKL